MSAWPSTSIRPSPHQTGLALKDGSPTIHAGVLSSAAKPQTPWLHAKHDQDQHLNHIRTRAKRLLQSGVQQPTLGGTHRAHARGHLRRAPYLRGPYVPRLNAAHCCHRSLYSKSVMPRACRAYGSKPQTPDQSPRTCHSLRQFVCVTLQLSHWFAQRLRPAPFPSKKPLGHPASSAAILLRHLTRQVNCHPRDKIPTRDAPIDSRPVRDSDPAWSCPRANKCHAEQKFQRPEYETISLRSASPRATDPRASECFETLAHAV